MHGVEALADQFERFAQALLQGALEFFVDRAAHLLEFLLVGLAHLVQLLADGGAQAVHALLVALDQSADLLGHTLELLFLSRTQLPDRSGEQFGCLAQAAGDLLAQLTAAPSGLFAASTQFLAHSLIGTGRSLANQQSHQQCEVDDDQQRKYNKQNFGGHGKGVSRQGGGPVSTLSTRGRGLPNDLYRPR